MKKFIIGLFALLTTAATITSCNKDDESKSSEAQILSMSFPGQAFMKQNSVRINENIITLAAYMEATQEQLTAVTPAIEVSPKATVVPASGTAVDFSEGRTVTFTVTAEDGTKNVYTATCSIDPQVDAYVLTMTLSESFVTQQPVIDEDNLEIHFKVADGTDPSLLSAIKPNVTISQGATMSPAPGTAIDLSNGVAKITVTAEDGENFNTYTLKYVFEFDGIYYGFNDWTQTGGLLGGGYDQPTSNDAAWTSINPAISLLKVASIVTGYTGDYAIKAVTDTQWGAGAMEITSIDTGGKEVSETLRIPRFLSGAAFIGSFSLSLNDIENFANSIKFGASITGQPDRIEGYYKYAPGTDYFINNVADEGDDEMSIMAVLFEVESDDDTLTFEDLENLSEKIIASGTLTSGATVTDYTKFNIPMTYNKPYDASKKYKFSMIMMSSKDGMNFTGAVGSKLTVDEVKVYFK